MYGAPGTAASLQLIRPVPVPGHRRQDPPPAGAAEAVRVDEARPAGDLLSVVLTRPVGGARGGRDGGGWGGRLDEDAAEALDMFRWAAAGRLFACPAAASRLRGGRDERGARMGSDREASKQGSGSGWLGAACLGR